MYLHEPGKTYNFKQQLAIGQEREALLDAYYGARYVIKPANPFQQRMGIDRFFEDVQGGGFEFSVEYKADETACRTGNIFFETISVDKEKKKGWALNSFAQVLIVFLPSKRLAYWAGMTTVKKNMPDWQRRFPPRIIPNKNGMFEYNTIGTLVPVAEFEKISVLFRIA